MTNLYDLTQGNYRVHRSVSYPDFPESKVVFDAEVTAQGTEWNTEITVSGNYEGPTDVVGVEDYEMRWTTDGETLSEKGMANLVLSSGETVRTVWFSSIFPEKPRFRGFPKAGETLTITFSAFEIEGNTMSYEWKGTVRVTEQRSP